MSTQADREAKRRATRFLAGLPAVLHLAGRDHPCTAHNLSRTGVLLVGKMPSPPEREVQFTIRSVGGDLEFPGRGSVMRLAEDPEGRGTQLGLEFETIDEADRQTLEALISRVVEGVAPAALEYLPLNASPQQIRETLEKLPLPHRIGLAARGNPRERGLLVQDPNPQVIDALARNPNLTVPEVRGILRLRPLLPTTLTSLARDPRWSGNEALQIMIAGHSNTPFSLAQRLAASLNPDALRKLIQQPGLNPALRLKIGRAAARGKATRY